MSFHVLLSQLAEIIAAGSVNLSDDLLAADVAGITTDTRTLKAGEVFVALRGEKFDGHEFVETALRKGAIAVITDYKMPGAIPQLHVKDTLTAYQAIARWWRLQFKIPVIGITGSCGKTTTKELVSAVLSSTKGNTHKTLFNYNNEIGVPKTLLEMSPIHDYAVIEMAMRAKGEIALLTQIACPTIGVITNVGTAHIGRLGSKEAIAQAKCELLAEMPSSSIAVLNHDDRRLMETAAGVWQGQTITYGLEGGDVRGELIDNETLLVEGMRLPLPLPGRHNASNFLAALAVAKILQVDWTPFKAGLAVNLPSGRAQRYNLPNDVVILDETYNAGLESMLAALQLLAETPGKRHIAVLGTMKELGEQSPEFHFAVGEAARKLNLDGLLILVDDKEAEAIALGAAPLPAECFTTHQAIVERLKEMVEESDRILFKASHSVALDRVVNQFRAEFTA